MITEIIDGCVLNNTEALVLTGVYTLLFVIMAFFITKLSNENYKLRLERMNDDVTKALLEECMKHARQVNIDMKEKIEEKDYDCTITNQRGVPRG